MVVVVISDTGVAVSVGEGEESGEGVETRSGGAKEDMGSEPELEKTSGGVEEGMGSKPEPRKTSGG